MYFRNSGLQMMLFHECIKSPVAEYPSTSNMANGLKQC